MIKKITSFVSSIFIAYPVYLLGWEWDGSRAITEFKGEKRIIYHPNDYLVPFDANLASKCSEEERISLNPDINGPETHFASLEDHDTDHGEPAVDVAAHFLEL